MKIEITIKENRQGNVEFKMERNPKKEPLTQKEAGYSKAISDLVAKELPKITERMGGRACVNMGNPEKLNNQ